MPCNDWENDIHYMRLYNFVFKLHVINDCAERCIKDITEFANVTTDPNQRDYILQVLNHHRDKMSNNNYTKDDMVNFL